MPSSAPKADRIPTSGPMSFPSAAEVLVKVPATSQGCRQPCKEFGNLGKPWEMSRFLTRYRGSSQGTPVPHKVPWHLARTPRTPRD